MAERKPMTVGDIKKILKNIEDDTIVLSTVNDGWVGSPVNEVSFDFLFDTENLREHDFRDFYPSANVARTDKDLRPPENIGTMKRVLVIHSYKNG